MDVWVSPPTSVSYPTSPEPTAKPEPISSTLPARLPPNRSKSPEPPALIQPAGLADPRRRRLPHGSPHPRAPTSLHASAGLASLPSPAPRPAPGSRRQIRPAGKPRRRRAAQCAAVLRPADSQPPRCARGVTNGPERLGPGPETGASAGVSPGHPRCRPSPPAPASASRAPPAPAGCRGFVAAPPCCASPCWAEAGGGGGSARLGAVPSRHRPPGGARRHTAPARAASGGALGAPQSSRQWARRTPRVASALGPGRISALQTHRVQNKTSRKSHQ